MNKEEKELLVMDLCARLPYGVFVEYDYGDGVKRVTKFHGNYLYLMMLGKLQWKDFKPYLRPMSSMTEEEINEFILISDTVLWLGSKRSTCILSLEQINWLNAHHFDHRGLIEMGLALEAPEDMYQF